MICEFKLFTNRNVAFTAVGTCSCSHCVLCTVHVYTIMWVLMGKYPGCVGDMDINCACVLDATYVIHEQQLLLIY